MTSTTSLQSFPLRIGEVAPYTDAYHCDGGCSGNPGPAGYAFVHSVMHETRREDGVTRSFFPKSVIARPIGVATNNVAELSGALHALHHAKQHDHRRVLIITDSQYVQLGIQHWIKDWRQYGWRTSRGRPVKNAELWQHLEASAASIPDLRWEWVKGHANNELNEEADRAAFTTSREQREFQTDFSDRQPIIISVRTGW